MKLRRKYAWAWLLWLGLFGVTELKAILDDDKAEGDYTLSHFIRRLLASRKGAVAGPWHWAFRAFLLGLFSWLVPHFDYFGLLCKPLGVACG